MMKNKILFSVFLIALSIALFLSFDPNVSMVKAANYRCTDTDNGKNYEVRGTTTVRNSDGVIGLTYEDFCSYDGRLAEFYCESPDSSSIAVEWPHKCQYGCGDGACLNPDNPNNDTVKLPLPINIRRSIENNLVVWIVGVIIIVFLVLIFHFQLQSMLFRFGKKNNKNDKGKKQKSKKR